MSLSLPLPRGPLPSPNLMSSAWVSVNPAQETLVMAASAKNNDDGKNAKAEEKERLCKLNIFDEDDYDEDDCDYDEEETTADESDCDCDESDCDCEDEEYKEDEDEEDKEDVEDESDNETASLDQTWKSLKEDVGTLETFTITVHGSCLDDEIPQSVKSRYWALCWSRGAVLHSRLRPDCFTKALSTPITNTVALADSIREASPGLLVTTFDDWIANAKDLEDHGMDIAFLRERIEKLRAFVSGKEGRPWMKQQEERQRYSKITRELRDIEGQIKQMTMKREGLAVLKES